MMSGPFPGQAAAQIPALTTQQIASMYNSYNGQLAQQAAANQNSQAIHNIKQYAAQQAAWGNLQYHANKANGQTSPPPRWMFDGKIMDVVTFANAVFGEDTPEATHFVLKHSK